MKRRWMLLSIAALAALAGCLVGEDGDAETAPPSAELTLDDGAKEWDFLDRLNAERTSRGLPALAMQPGLRQIAREWSADMPVNGFRHRPDLAAQVQGRVDGNWQGVGENVGRGGSVASLHAAFMNSPSHRDNILGNWRYVGIGSDTRDGTIWVTVNFLRTASQLPTVSPNTPPPPPADACGILQVNESLPPGAGQHSCNGAYYFVHQGDGNLVLYGPRGALWSSGTHGRASSTLVMQGDGNLVLYGPGGALWSSGTYGRPGAFLAIQGDGNVVIYSAEWQPLWATHTVQ